MADDFTMKSAGGDGRGRAMAIVLIVCVAIVAFWEVMASRSRRPFTSFQTTAEDFRGFTPSSPSWVVRSIPVKADATEPNILAYEVRGGIHEDGGSRPTGTPALQYPAAQPVLVRLVHGYNMRDCMRLKGYTVELLEERRQREPAGKEAASNDIPGRLQVWRLTSSTGEASIWITGMVRSGDFSGTDMDVRSMAFPRISIPDDPRWLPVGITWQSLRHPVSNFRQFLRAKWNSSRCDLPTFLGLRQPAWANEELLTMVAAWRGPHVRRNEEPQVTARVLAAYDLLYAGLRKWRSESSVE